MSTRNLKISGLVLGAFVLAIAVSVIRAGGVEPAARNFFFGGGGSAVGSNNAPTQFDFVAWGSNPDAIAHGGAVIDIASATTSAAFRNQTGKTIFVTKVMAHLNGGTASSTYEFNVGTSTANGVTPENSVNNYNGIIDSYTFATSTGSRFVASNDTTDYGISGTTTPVMVRDQEYVVFSLATTTVFASDPLGVGCNRDPVTVAAGLVNGCESATSTNRGFNPQAFIEYFFEN